MKRALKKRRMNLVVALTYLKEMKLILKQILLQSKRKTHKPRIKKVTFTKES